MKVKGAKLTDEQVIAAAADIKNGMSYSEAAVKYGVTGNGIWRAVMQRQALSERPARQRRQMKYPTIETCEQVKMDREADLPYWKICEKYDITVWTARAIYEGRLRRLSQ